MKKNYFLPVGYLLLGCATFVIPPLQAADDATAKGVRGHEHLTYLTEAEKQELQTDREAVLAANPNLKSQEEALRQERKSLFRNKEATREDKKAYSEKVKAYRQALDAALVQQDPNIQPVLEKIAAHHKHRQTT